MQQEIIILALAATTIVKALVDMSRLAFNAPPRWLSPLFALVVGILVSFLLRLANGEVITSAIAAQCVLAGLLAAASAVGVTELQKKAN